MSSHIRKTILLVFFWIFMCYLDYSYMIVVPFVLKDNINEYQIIYTSYMGELFSLIILLYTIDNVDYGRKKSLISYSLGAAITSFAIYTLKDIHMAFLFLLRLLTKCNFSTLNCYTIELFPTSIRT